MTGTTKLNGFHSGGVMTIKEVVMAYKARWEDYGDSRTMYIKSMVIFALQQLNIFKLNGMDVIYMTTTKSSLLPLPSDFIDYTKIGIIDAHGRLWTLTLNDNVFQVPLMDCGEDISTALTGRIPPPNTGYWWVPHYGADGGYNDTMYSVGGGFNVAYYSIDRQGRNLVINGLPEGTTVVMEYKSTGIKLDDTTIIPTEALETIIAWIDWQDALRGKNGIHPDRAEAIYEGLENQLVTMQLRRTFDEYQDIIFESWHQGVKRGG